jgi:hypothetical protein
MDARRVTLSVSPLLSVILLFAAAPPARADVQQNDNGAVATATAGGDASTEPLPLQDLLLARGFRLLFETTVEHVDLEKLRANGIRKIREKDEADYRRQLNKVFDDLESVGVDEILGVTRTSSRDDVIAVLQRVDQQALVGALDAVPDASIANLIERKVREKGASSLAEVKQLVETELAEFVDGLSG